MKDMIEQADREVVRNLVSGNINRAASYALIARNLRDQRDEATPMRFVSRDEVR